MSGGPYVRKDGRASFLRVRREIDAIAKALLTCEREPYGKEWEAIRLLAQASLLLARRK